MSIYKYEAMKEIYLKEKHRKEEERRKHEEEKFNSLMLILQGNVIEAIKEGKDTCILNVGRLKDGKRAAIEKSNIDLYMKRLQEIFPDTTIEKIIVTEYEIRGDKETNSLLLEIKWKKFD
jgi:hypothetical protein